MNESQAFWYGFIVALTVCWIVGAIIFAIIDTKRMEK